MHELSSRLHLPSRLRPRLSFLGCLPLVAVAVSTPSCNTYTPDLVGLEAVTAEDDDVPEPSDDDSPTPGIVVPSPTPATPSSGSCSPSPCAPEPDDVPDPSAGPEPSAEPEPSEEPNPGGTGPNVPTPEGGGGNTSNAGSPSTPTGGMPPVQTGGMPGVAGMAGAGTAGVPAGGSGTNGGAPQIPTAGPIELIEDFEDGNNVILAIDGRNGYWFVDGNTEGTITPFEVVALDPANPELTSSTKGIHVVADGFETGSWAVLGVDLNGGEAYPEAANYAGITFWGRTDDEGTFRMQLPTTSTEGDDDHFGITVSLTSTWTAYLVPFDEQYISQQDFGEEQTFDPSELVGIQFSLLSGHAGFDIWIDEIRFQPPDE